MRSPCLATITAALFPCNDTVGFIEMFGVEQEILVVYFYQCYHVVSIGIVRAVVRGAGRH